MEELKHINLNFDESISSKGYNISDKTLTLTKHPLCVDPTLVNDCGLPRVNTPEIVAGTLDVINLRMCNTSLYVPKEGPVGIEALYKIIDSPTLVLNSHSLKFQEPVQCYFDPNTNVGVMIYVNGMDHTINGYHNIHSIIVSREPNKQERIEQFVKTHCSSNPEAIPYNMSRKQANDHWDNTHGISLTR